MACVDESARFELPPTWSVDFCMLEISKPMTSSMTKMEYILLKSLKDDSDIRLHEADKGNFIVVLSSPHMRRRYLVY
jgi:hypothetical protein